MGRPVGDINLILHLKAGAATPGVAHVLYSVREIPSDHVHWGRYLWGCPSNRATQCLLSRHSLGQGLIREQNHSECYRGRDLLQDINITPLGWAVKDQGDFTNQPS